MAYRSGPWKDNDKIVAKWSLIPFPPVSHWKMNDDAANTTVVDSIGLNNGIAQQNTSILHTTGKINGALTFNGNSDYIVTSLDMTTVFNVGDPIYISLWFKTTVKDDFGYLLAGRPGNGPDFYVLVDSPSGQLRVRLYGGFEAKSRMLEYDFDDGNWHHVVWGTDGASSHRLYTDSILQSSIPTPGSDNRETALMLGARSDPAKHFFHGTLDDIRIYDFALDQTQINFLYNDGNGTEA